MFGTFAGTFLLFIAISVVVFLVLREVWCWYWKINEIVSLLHSINRKMDYFQVSKGSNIQETIKYTDVGATSGYKVERTSLMQMPNPDLIRAAWKGNVDLVRNLIASGADVNTKDDNSWTALIMAVENDHIETVRVLLANGADVNARTNHGMTALKMAIEKGYNDIVQLLKEAGAKE